LTESSTFPRPLEWEFAETSVVVSWLRIRKLIPLGHYVEVIGGEYKGRKGWFDGLEHGIHGARVIELEDTEKPLAERMMVNLFSMFDSHF
jgi:hypothetical protein